MDDLSKIYDACLAYTCPPSEGVKTKAEGCYNALNDYGKEPDRDTCMLCWKAALSDALFSRMEAD